MLPFKLVIPSSPRGSGRKKLRFPAKGLSLTCTRILPSRLHGADHQNLALELRDVGSGGVRFVASEPVPVSCAVNLQIRDEATGSSLQARGATAWVETRRENGMDRVVVGAKFDEILTPPTQSAWYFEGRVALHHRPWGSPKAQAATMPRAAARFSIPNCGVTLERDHRFRESGKAGNLATRLLDLSRAGAQVACVDQVSRGERMRLTIDLKNFNDIFTVEAESVWVRYSTTSDSREWRVGLAFGELSHAQLRQVTTIESWFRGR